MKTRFAVFAFPWLLAVPGASAQQSNSLPVDSLAERYLEKASAADLVVGIHDNGRQHVFYFSTNKPVDTARLAGGQFELGTLSETFTCILYADMSVRGLVGDDDPVNKYLPVELPPLAYENIVCRRIEADEYENPLREKGFVNIRFTHFICLPDSSTRPQPVRLCYLGTHTSGLPGFPYNLHGHKADPYAGYSSDDLYAFLRDFRLDETVGFEYRHSPLGIALLGHALSRRAGLPFDTLMAALLDSLHMNASGVGAASARLDGHDEKGRPAPPWTSDVMAPAMGMHATIGDMMHFLALNVSKDKSYVVDLLDYTHNPRIREGDLKGVTNEYALGWKVSPLPAEGQSMVWNEGRSGGFASWVGFNESNHTGVVVLSTSARPVGDIGKTLVKALGRYRW